MLKDLISVIVPVYNVEKYLKRCVDSLLRQSYPELEIILVDDGSTDDSGKLCDELALTDKRIKVVHQKNRGLGPARNTGMDHMSGEYVAFVDSDDWIEPDMYRHMLSAMSEHHCDVATCGRKTVTDEKTIGYVFCLPTVQVLHGREIIKKYLLQQDMNMAACDKLFKASLFDDIRFPGEHLVSEDIVPIYQVLKKASGVVLTGKPFYNYYYREGSLSKSSFNPKLMGACRYSEEVARCVESDFPDLIGAAKCFEYDFLISIYRSIRSSDYHGPEEKQVYTEICEQKKKMLKNSFLSRRQKTYTVLAVLKLDRIPDKIYREIKKAKQNLYSSEMPQK